MVFCSFFLTWLGREGGVGVSYLHSSRDDDRCDRYKGKKMAAKDGGKKCTHIYIVVKGLLAHFRRQKIHRRWVRGEMKGNHIQAWQEEFGSELKYQRRYTIKSHSCTL